MIFMLFIIFRGAKKPRKYGIYKDFIGSFDTIYWEFYYYLLGVLLLFWNVDNLLLGVKLLYFCVIGSDILT